MGPTELRSILTKTINQVARKHRGQAEWKAVREKFSIWHVLKIYIACVSMKICPGVLYKRLEKWTGFRRSAELPNRLISLSQLKKRLNTPLGLRALLACLKQSAISALRAIGPQEVRIVAMDLTRIESDPDRDEHAAWGIDSKGHFWGYKLGLIISENGVVLGMTLMKGNLVEFSVNRRLLRLAADVVKTSFGEFQVDYVMCDAGFDGESTFQTAHQELRARVLCPAKRRRNPRAKQAKRVLWRAMKYSPHRFADQQLWEIEGTREVFRKRSEIERVNGQLKDTAIRIDEIPPKRRGVKRLLPLCLSKLIVYNVALHVNKRMGESLRSIKALVG